MLFHHFQRFSLGIHLHVYSIYIYSIYYIVHTHLYIYIYIPTLTSKAALGGDAHVIPGALNQFRGHLGGQAQPGQPKQPVSPGQW